MGIFGFACEKCWDYNCNCTQEELEEFRSRRKKTKPIALEWSKSEPFVAYGNVIIKDDIQFFVKAIDNGLPLCDRITNVSEGIDCDVIIKPPYNVLTSCSE